MPRSRAEVLDIKHRAFAREYVAKGLNGTQAAMEVFKKDSPEVAKVRASRLLTNDNVKLAIREELEASGLLFNDVVKVHKRNINQQKNLVVSQNAVTDYYDLLGLRKRAEQANTNIGIIIERDI